MTIVDQLRSALSQAIHECEEHNGEYHHITPNPVLEEWRRLIDDTGTVATKEH
jgi:hypothetical protein